MPKSPVRPWQPDSNKLASGKPGAVHNAIDVGVSGLVGRQFGGAAQFVQRFVGPFEAGERQTECMVQPRVARRCGNRVTQHIFTFRIPPQTPIEIGEVDRCRRKLRVQAERGFVFGLCIPHEAAPGIKDPMGWSGARW